MHFEEIARFLVPCAVVLTFVGVAAVTDVRKYKVQNIVTFPLMLTGFIYNGWASYTQFLGTDLSVWESCASSALGLAFGFVILLPFYLMGGMGAGDVKLLMGIGAWLQWPNVFIVFITGALAGGIYSLALMVWSGNLSETWWKFRLLAYRMSTAGKHFTGDDEIEEAVNAPDRRRKLLHYSAMWLLGIVCTLAYVSYHIVTE